MNSVAMGGVATRWTHTDLEIGATWFPFPNERTSPPGVPLHMLGVRRKRYSEQPETSEAQSQVGKPSRTCPEGTVEESPQAGTLGFPFAGIPLSGFPANLLPARKPPTQKRQQSAALHIAGPAHNSRVDKMLVDRRTPMAIGVELAVNHIEVEALHAFRHRSGLAFADDPPVDAAHRRDLRARSRKEYFVADV